MFGMAKAGKNIVTPSTGKIHYKEKYKRFNDFFSQPQQPINKDFVLQDFQRMDLLSRAAYLIRLLVNNGNKELHDRAKEWINEYENGVQPINKDKIQKAISWCDSRINKYKSFTDKYFDRLVYPPYLQEIKLLEETKQFLQSL